MSVTSVAIQFTLIDALSKGVDAIKHRMKGLASANKEVQQSFDNMAKSGKRALIAGVATREIYRGLKPAVGAAGELQAAVLGARAELAGSVQDSRKLSAELAKIKSTAFEVQAWTPFNQAQIVALEAKLIKSGANIQDIIGKNGAAAASAALGTYESLDPVEMGKNLIGIATPFKLQANEYMRLADEISRASSASVVGAAEIAETAKYAAPAMSELNRSTHEMLVLSAMLAQRGLGGSMSGTGLRQFFNAAAKQNVFRNETGGLKSLAEMTAILRKELGGLGEAERLSILTKIFDVRGAPVALALMDEGAASFAEIEKKMAGALPLSEKLQTQMEGLNKQWEALRGTSRSTLAELYQPALKPISSLVGMMNEFVTLIGMGAQKSELLGQAVSGVSLGALATGGLATLGLGGAALWYGRKVLKGVGGVKGLFSSAGSVAGGIAAGKAVEAATGVQPVFVTNWPATFGGGSVADVMGGAAGGGLLRKAGTLAKGSWKWLTGLGSTALATPGGQVAAAGLLGYGAGTGIDKLGGALRGKEHLLDDTTLGDKIGLAMNQIAAFFGNEASKQAIEINMNIDQAGRVTTESNNMRTRTRAMVRRGEF